MASFMSTDPRNGATLATYSYMSQAELAKAADDAYGAFIGWRAQPLARRLERLAALATLLENEAARLGELATLEMGKPLSQAKAEVAKCALACRYYVESAPGTLADESVYTLGDRSYVAFEPIGPVLSIMPWNFPYWQVIRFAAPVLAAGNTILLKHADNTTGVALEIEKLCLRAGFPPCAFQTLRANHDQIAELIGHPHVVAVTLTGSERAGKAVAANAGANLKKTVLELGGSDAYVVLADADIEAAADICVRARLVNSGQSCVAAKRFIIEDSVYDEFAAAFVAKAKTKYVVDPMDPRSDVGPLAKASIRNEVATQVEKSLGKGARELMRSRIPTDGDASRGFYYPITVLGDVKPGMACFDEEVFGPVAALIRAPSAEGAIQLANRSRYGLGGAVFSRDIDRAEKLARYGLEAGFVVVNGMVQSDPRLPFGGVKASGYGRELGTFGLREFVNVKTVVV